MQNCSICTTNEAMMTTLKSLEERMEVAMWWAFSLSERKSIIRELEVDQHKAPIKLFHMQHGNHSLMHKSLGGLVKLFKELQVPTITKKIYFDALVTLGIESFFL